MIVEGKVSLWLGRSSSEARLRELMTCRVGDGASGSELSRAFGFGRYAPAMAYSLAGASCEDEVIPRFEALDPELPADYDTMVLSYDIAHVGPTSWHAGDVSFELIGTVDYPAGQ